MTTIAYRDGILAADSRAYGGPYTASPGAKTKIFRLANGDRLGVSSAVVGGGEQLRAWFEDPAACDRTLLPDGFTVLLVKASGEIFYGKDRVQLSGPIEAEYFAIGTGDDLALGAMAMGASAIEAVRAASKFDPHTGGDVRHLEP